jgi:hypothetical protein
MRTNLVFFLIFFTLVPAFGLLAGTFLNLAEGKAATAAKCQEAAGAFAFVTCLLGWYIFFAISKLFPTEAFDNSTNDG